MNVVIAKGSALPIILLIRFQALRKEIRFNYAEFSICFADCS